MVRKSYFTVCSAPSTLPTYRRDIFAGLELCMRVINTQTGKILWEEPVGESRNWQTEWQTFSGDDRALNGQLLKSANAFPPHAGNFTIACATNWLMMYSGD